ncbi:MAG: dihydrofolate reductase [Patescibacteria group bacterium]|nr:dihydrofolate reductase [Patescibacteria group bacterium]
MRKIIVREMITVDGFFAGLNGEIDWHHVDAEFNEQSAEFLDGIDTLIFGRVTYDLMAGYWPTPEGSKDDPVIADKMNSLSKIVFSKNADMLAWNNSRALSEIRAEEIRKLKEAPGKDIAIFGSGMIVSALTELGLIDEYRFVVNPVILGKGKTLFADLEKKPDLELLDVHEFKSGNVLLSYRMMDRMEGFL